MAELCKSQKVKYVVINSGVMEFILEDIYEHAVHTFQDTPEFGILLSHSETKTTSTLTTKISN